MEVEATSPSAQIKPVGLPARLLSDERLAREIESGRESAFTVLFHRHHQPLYRYCRSLVGNDQDAQDALQSALTKALLALRNGKRNAPLRPWLFRIAHNESVSVIRSRAATAELPPELEASQRLPEVIESNERFATLLRDLHELSENQRAALVLRELSGLSHEEIAEVLKISVGAAKQTILEARRSLQEFAEGRAAACSQIEELISADDRRSLRSRRVRAHLQGCPACAAFAEAVPQRRAEMLALWPALPAAGAAGLLARVTGASSGHAGGGAATLAASTTAKGVGTAVSIKAAAFGAAALATVAAGTFTVLHHAPVAPAARAPHAVSGTRVTEHGSQHRAASAAPPLSGVRAQAVRVRGVRHGAQNTTPGTVGAGLRVQPAHHEPGVSGSHGLHGQAGAHASGHGVPPASQSGAGAGTHGSQASSPAAHAPKPTLITRHGRKAVHRAKRTRLKRARPVTVRRHRRRRAPGSASSSGSSGAPAAGTSPGHGNAGGGQASGQNLVNSQNSADTTTTS